MIDYIVTETHTIAIRRFGAAFRVRVWVRDPKKYVSTYHTCAALADARDIAARYAAHAP